MAFSRVKIVLDSREKVQSTLSKGDMQKGNNQPLRFYIGGLFKCWMQNGSGELSLKQCFYKKGVNFFICQRWIYSQIFTDQIYFPTWYTPKPDKINEITLFKTLDIWQRGEVSLDGQETSVVSPMIVPVFCLDKVSWLQCRKCVFGEAEGSLVPGRPRKSLTCSLGWRDRAESLGRPRQLESTGHSTREERAAQRAS